MGQVAFENVIYGFNDGPDRNHEHESDGTAVLEHVEVGSSFELFGEVAVTQPER